MKHASHCLHTIIGVIICDYFIVRIINWISDFTQEKYAELISLLKSRKVTYDMLKIRKNIVQKNLVKHKKQVFIPVKSQKKKNPTVNIKY